jgi:hypothetical protein
MALVLPILILLIGGIVDFGLMFNAQIGLTHAAREGVRVEAIGTGDPLQEASDAFVAFGTDPLTASLVRGCPHPNGAILETRAYYRFFFLPFEDRELVSEAVMRCGG